jgi:hypothetical protein
VLSRLLPRSCAPRDALRPAGVPGVIAGSALAAVLASGCGTSATPTAAATAAASPSPNASAYVDCLEQHGVTVPTARPSTRPTVRPTAFPSPNSAMMKARQACASLRPKGGFGGRGGNFGAALQAFRTCMASHGEAIPPATRPTARPTPGPSASPRADRFLNGLNPGNPKVADAVKACASKLPAFPRPSPSPTG